MPSLAHFKIKKSSIIGSIFIISSCSLMMMVIAQHLEQRTLKPHLLPILSHEEEKLAHEMEEANPNLPLSYWLRVSRKPKRSENRNNCSPKFPNLFEVKYNNLYWQTLWTNNATIHLYSAFNDNRYKTKFIRILTMIDRVHPTLKLYCQIWLEDELNSPHIVRVLKYQLVWYDRWGYKNGFDHTYLMTCRLPSWIRNSSSVAAVSLVMKRCDQATNALKVTYNKPSAAKKPFVVCVKSLDFPYEDISSRLVEWIELLGLLGASKIYLYQLALHENVSRVLRHYERLGRVGITPLTLPGSQTNSPGFQHLYLKRNAWQKRMNELVPYNDCFYRHMYEYEFIVLLDVDEVIVPIQDDTWLSLMRKIAVPARKIDRTNYIGKSAKVWYSVRNVCFSNKLITDNKAISKYTHMLQHVYRSNNSYSIHCGMKSFYRTDRVIALHNHYPIACYKNTCPGQMINQRLAQLQHYKSKCKGVKDKNSIYLDNTIWRYRAELETRTSATLRALGFLKSSD